MRMLNTTNCEHRTIQEQPPIRASRKPVPPTTFPNHCTPYPHNAHATLPMAFPQKRCANARRHTCRSRLLCLCVCQSATPQLTHPHARRGASNTHGSQATRWQSSNTHGNQHESACGTSGVDAWSTPQMIPLARRAKHSVLRPTTCPRQHPPSCPHALMTQHTRALHRWARTPKWRSRDSAGLLSTSTRAWKEHGSASDPFRR